MCRWFAYLAPQEDCLLEDVLITPAHALSKQVHDHYLPLLLCHTNDPDADTTEAEISVRNRLQNVDGFGIAWYTLSRAAFNEADGPRPVLYKHDQPPTNDAVFKSICANTQSTAVYGHIRAATATAVTPVNNHPFNFGRHVIMHNGVVTDIVAVKRQMTVMMEDDAFGNIHGGTDSEHLAALYMTFLTKNSKTPGKASWEKTYPVSEMKEALLQTFKAIINIQQKVLGVKMAEANSLNVCCSDGEQMIAFRFRNHQIEQPPSLYWSDKAGPTLNRKYPDNPDGEENPNATKNEAEHGKHMIVASEPTTYKVDDWHLIPKNHAVLVEKDGSYRIEPLEIADEHFSVAITTQPG